MKQRLVYPLLLTLTVILLGTFPMLATLPPTPFRTDLVVPTGSNTVTNGTNFQTVLDAAACGDNVILTAGATYDGTFTLANKSCTSLNPITIKSTGTASLPSGRIGPSNVSNMARVRTLGGGNFGEAFRLSAGAGWWVLDGLEITDNAVDTIVINMLVDASATGVHDITLQRSYLHNKETGTNYYRSIRFGVQFEGSGLTMKWNYVNLLGYYQIAMGQGMYTPLDTIALLSVGGNTMTVTDNYLATWYNSVFTGGGDTSPQNTATVTSSSTTSGTFSNVTGLSSGIVIRFDLEGAGTLSTAGSTLTVTRTSGVTLSSLDIGRPMRVTQASGGTATGIITITNVSGNVITGTLSAGGAPPNGNVTFAAYETARVSSVAGSVVNYTPFGIDALTQAPLKASWNYGDQGLVYDLTLQQNTFYIDPDFAINVKTNNGNNPKGYFEIKNSKRMVVNGNYFTGFPAALAWTASNQNGTAPWITDSDTTFTNNWIDAYQTTLGITAILYADNQYVRTNTPSANVDISNNFFIHTRNLGFMGGYISSMMTGGVINMTVAHNTVINDSTSGSGYNAIMGSDAANTGYVFRDNIISYLGNGMACFLDPFTLGTCWPSGTFSKNVVVDTQSAGFSTSVWGAGSALSPIPTAFSSVGFVDTTTNNYALAGSSPYKGQGTGGTDPGVDMTALIAALPYSPLTNEHIAASCSASDVQDAMTAATENGAIVSVPACPSGVAWTSRVIWNAPPNATFRGAGNTTSTGSNDRTVFINQYKPGGDNTTADPVLQINGNNTGTFRMYGFTLRGGGPSVANYSYALIWVFGNNHSFRTDHIRVDLRDAVFPAFNYAVPTAFEFYGYTTGVIDHSLFNYSDRGGAFTVHYNGYGAGGEGDESWAAATGLGTSDFLFFENNTITNLGSGGTVNDCYHGGKFVVRFNTIQGSSFAQTHPTGGSGRSRGCRGWEAYKNTITVGGAGASQFNGFFMSSGTGMVWGNDAAANALSNFITAHSMRRNAATYPCQFFTPPNGWGCAGTSFTGTGSNWDQNLVATTGFRPLDQPGNGRGDLLVNPFPSVTNQATGCIWNQSCAWPRQESQPWREWLNNWSCPSCGGSFVAVYEPDVLVENSTYYLFKTNFNGTQGNGAGILAARPTTCTVGTFYWAADQGSWNLSGSGGQGEGYECTALNTWTKTYVPYTFPHPLTNEGSAITTISPSSGVQNTAVLPVTITGTNTGWVQGVTVASFSGTGITVNSTTVSSPTSAVASIAISPNATTGARNVTMTTGSNAVTATNGFTVTPSVPVPTKLGVTVQPPLVTAAGSTFATAPVFAVQFSDGSTDASSTAAVTISLCSGTGTLNGTLVRSAVAGLATFPGLSVTTVVGGVNYRICATATNLTSTTTNVFTINVPAATPTKVSFTTQPPTTIASGITMSNVRVSVQFANGTTDTTSTASVFVGLCAGSPAGTLSGTQTRAAVSGVATFDDLAVTVANTANGYSLCATSSGLSGATSNQFSVTAASGTCQTQPLVVRNVKWPTAPTGSRSLGWNSGGFSVATVSFIYPGTALFTDTRGCQATVLKP